MSANARLLGKNKKIRFFRHFPRLLNNQKLMSLSSGVDGWLELGLEQSARDKF